MRTIQPGESLVYEFQADFAGAYMYHCGTAPALHHIGNGMYGAIIIDPPDLEPVDQEFVIVQSELYLGPQGQPGDLTKMMNEDWDAVVFNGYLAQYKFAPIHVETGKRYRVWVVNDGPERELCVPHRRHHLRHRVQGGRLHAAARRHARWLAGARPAAGTGRVRRVHLRRGRPVPVRHAQVRQRRQGCASGSSPWATSTPRRSPATDRIARVATGVGECIVMGNRPSARRPRGRCTPPRQGAVGADPGGDHDAPAQCCVAAHGRGHSPER